MAYRVRLIHIGENLPYEIGGITADNEEMAINKAKKFIVEEGYWFPWEDNIKERYNKLKVEKISIDNV